MNYPEIRYLERLADLYPTIAAASTEVINMEAILPAKRNGTFSDRYPRGGRSFRPCAEERFRIRAPQGQ